MELFGYGVLAVLIFLCVYALTDRICRCVEHCAVGRAYEKIVENNIKPEDFEIGLKK